MLPNIYRLPGFLIPLVLKYGIRVFNHDYIVYVRKNSQKIPRLAILVPKKIDKRSVIRNRIKRLFVESVRLIVADLKEYEYVIMAKTDISDAKSKELKNNLYNTLKISGLIKG